MTLREISANILSLLDAEHELGINQVAYTVKYYRSLFLRRDYQRGSRLHPFEQELTDTFDFLQSSNFGRNALKSQTELPTPVRFKNRQSGIVEVTERDGDYSYPVYNHERQRYQKYEKYTSSNTFGTYYDNSVFLFGGLPNSLSSGDTRQLEIRGVFEDPERIMKLNDETSSTMDKEFPMGSDMVQRITQGLIGGELSVIYSNSTQNNNE